MKITIKNDWDIPLRFPYADRKPKGLFIGRKKELSHLVNELKRRETGSILICGHRGVGKTSFIYKAIWELKAKDNLIIPILLNAAQLEAESIKDIIESKKILENLIRRLYSMTRDIDFLDNKIDSHIIDLYYKAIASNYEHLEIFSLKSQISNEIIEQKASSFKFTMKDFRVLIFLIPWLISLLLILTKIIPIELLNDLVSLIIGLPLPLFLNYAYSKSKIRKNLKLEDKKSELLYKFDASICNIEYDLEKIHREIRDQNQKLIYIIDELDKLDPKQVIEVLKFFKNLFTLSDAIFIFIGGEEIFDLEVKLSPNQSEIYRAKEYTYFTSKYFLSRPNWSDLNNYFDQIILNVSDLEKNSLIVLKNALFFEAKNDFFDLKSFIKSRIIDFDENDNPIIKFEENNEDIQKSRFYKSILLIFEEKYISLRFNEWKNNEMLLRQLFKQVHYVFNLNPNQTIVDPSDETIRSEIFREFYSLLNRLGAFRITKEEKIMIRGLQTPIRNYQYIGKIPKEPPDKLDELTEFEQRYLEVFEHYINFLLPLYNAKRKIKGEELIERNNFYSFPYNFSKELSEWGFHASYINKENFTIYNTLINERPPFEYRRENIEAKTNQMLVQNNTVFNNFHNILLQAIMKIYSGYNLKNLQLQGDNKLFTGDLEELRRQFVNFNPNVIFNSDYSNQILITHNHLEIIEKYKEQIEENSEHYKIINISKKGYRDTKIDGVSIISFESEENLNNSLIDLFDSLPKFLEKSE